MQFYESVQPKLSESVDTPEMITSLKPNEIFVFGSNEGGKHAGGAAKIAYQKFGAEWGEGIGQFGQTYAIPTLNANFDMIPVAKIGKYVNDFIEHAKENPKLHYWVTPIGTGIAGYTFEEIAPLFKKALSVPNISLPKSFKDII